MKRRTSIVLLLMLLMSGAALASEQSQRLYARGLVDFHAEHYTEALDTLIEPFNPTRMMP